MEKRHQRTFLRAADTAETWLRRARTTVTWPSSAMAGLPAAELRTRGVLE